jgi:threonine dehydrogenase-like Zn-dependent dehydrogenase
MYIIQASLATLIPNDIPLRRALLTANMETAINAMWDTKPTIGDKTYVIGAGIVGILMAYVLSKSFGIDVIIIDKDSKKRKICKALGLIYKSDSSCINEADIIYECSGNVDVINELISKCSLETKICILSWYGKQQTKIKMGENCFSRRLEIIFSQVGNISAYKSKKWNNLSRRLFHFFDLYADIFPTCENIISNLLEKQFSPILILVCCLPYQLRMHIFVSNEHFDINSFITSTLPEHS